MTCTRLLASTLHEPGENHETIDRVPAGIPRGAFTGDLAFTQVSKSASELDTKAWRDVYLKIAKQMSLEFTDGQDPNDSARLIEKPMLGWDNPVRIGRTEGDFFVWMDRERPGSLFCP